MEQPAAAWTIPFACSLLSRDSWGKEGSQNWAVGQVSFLVRCAGLETGVLLVLQVTSNLAVRRHCQHRNRSLGLCILVDPDIKEIDFHLFYIKKIPCRRRGQRRENLGIRLVLGQPSSS